MSIVSRIETRAKYDPGIEVDSENVLCLHRNENLFITKDWMREFVASVVSEVDVVRYPEPSSMSLRCELAKLYDVTPENVFVGNGSDEVLSDLLGLLRERYETLSTLDVHFKVYDMLADRFDFAHRTLPGSTFETQKIDDNGWDGLALIDSPNAITGHHFSDASLRRLAESPGTFIIWDNAYGEFSRDGHARHLPENMVLIRSFSKFFGLAAARVGYCIASTDIVDQLLARKDSFNVNAFGQHLALRAFSRYPEFSQFRDVALYCRETLARKLRERQFDVRESGGNYVFATHPQLSAQYLQERLLGEGIAVRRFPGTLTENFLRITVPPQSDIDRLIRSLDEIMASSTNGSENAQWEIQI